MCEDLIQNYDAEIHEEYIIHDTRTITLPHMQTIEQL